MYVVGAVDGLVPFDDGLHRNESPAAIHQMQRRPFAELLNRLEVLNIAAVEATQSVKS